MFIGSKNSPERRLRAEHAEKSVGDARDAHNLRLIAASHGRVREAVHRHAIERTTLIFPIHEIRSRNRKSRHARKTFRGRRMPDAHETIRLRVGKRPQKNAVHHAEDRGIRANPKSENENRDSRESRIFADQPKAESQILQQISHVRISIWSRASAARTKP